MIDYANRKPKPLNYGKTLQIRVSEEMLKKLEEKAKNENVMKAKIVRQAIEEFLSCHN